MQETLAKNEVVLLGIGHTNAHVLRMWRMDPIPDAGLTCVSNHSIASYSGMLPGVLSGQYLPQRMEIDLVRLCAAAGARFVRGTVTGLDVDARQLLFEDRPPLPFDALSIGIGSVPTQAGLESADESLLAIKPMQTFPTRLESRLRDLAATTDGRPLRIAVVGAGVGGVEIAFCLPARVRSLLGETPMELTLIDAHDRLVHGMRDKTADLVRKELEGRGVRLRLGRRITHIGAGRMTLDNGEQAPTDLVLWATSAAPPPLLAKLGLPTDEAGFLLTRPTLQTVADAPVFVVGDSATLAESPIPKAGVYAVRQGPILWENIRRQLDGRSLVDYEPQKGFLKLLNTGDGRSIGEYKGRAFRGRWVWRLKDFIDGRFMDKYQDYRPMEMNGQAVAGEPAMRCAGCGGKVSGSVLSRVLARLDVPRSEHVLLGLEAPDDAAIVRPPDGRPMTVTADFFAAPLDDPYLVGRIAALNAASDLFALGAKPLAALALATIPVGQPRRQEQLLYELLAGSLHEWRAMDATLIGGHTIEGPRLTVGFTVLGDLSSGPPRTKGRLRIGDRLILTKPLGTGILLAAHMRALCRGEWMEELLRSMLTSNQQAASLIEEFDIAGLTDVTGFGLAGHLLEMLHASDVAAELSLDDLPLLLGTAECYDQGVESTLAPANRTVEAEIAVSEALRRRATYAALFDPQTSGGLLLGVPEAHLDRVLTRLAEQSDVPARVIGGVVESRTGGPRIRIA